LTALKKLFEIVGSSSGSETLRAASAQQIYVRQNRQHNSNIVHKNIILQFLYNKGTQQKVTDLII